MAQNNDDEAGGFSQSLDSEIGPDGGSVEIGGCTILFPKGAFAAANRVHSAVSTGGEDESDKQIAVSPKLHCSSELPLLAPVRVKIPIWVLVDDPTIRVRILGKEDVDGAEWEEMGSIPAYAMRRPFVEFDCNRLSWFRAIIDYVKGVFGFLTYYMTTTLYQDHLGNFKVFFHLDDLVVEDEARRDAKLGKFQYTPHIFDSQDILLNDKIKFSLKSESEEYLKQLEYEFNPHEHEFTLDKGFLQGSYYKSFPSLLKPLPARNALTIVTGTLEVNGEKKSEVPARLMLLAEPEEDTEQKPSTSTKTDQSTKQD